jgi:hypothetical protein
MPPSIRWPRAMVYFTGVCEIAGAVGLLLRECRRAAAYALIAFFLAVLRANIHAARVGVTLRKKVCDSGRARERMQAEAAAGAVRGAHACEGGASMSLPEGSASGSSRSRSPECARLATNGRKEIPNRASTNYRTQPVSAAMPR